MWKEIRGYEGFYEVSDDGQVRGLDRMLIDKNGKQRMWRGKIMKQTNNAGRDGDGYNVVNLRKFGTSHVTPVHVLVAATFLPNPDNLPTVNHIDGDKSNNMVSNLEWASYSENNMHALKHGLRKPRGNAILQKSLDGDNIASFRSVSEASRVTGVSRGMISHCLHGRAKTAGKYKWEKLLESVTTIS